MRQWIANLVLFFVSVLEPLLPLALYYSSLLQHLLCHRAMSGLFGKLEGMLEGQGQQQGQGQGQYGGSSSSSGGGYGSQLDSAEPYLQKAEAYIEGQGGSDGMLFKAEQAFKSWSAASTQHTHHQLLWASTNH